MNPPLAVRAVIFDLSGTVIDHGSRGPAAAFVQLFARHGVQLTMEEARAPMGLDKRDHIRELLANPALEARWRAVHGSLTRETADRLYEEFVPLQTEVLRDHSTLIVGVKEVVAELAARRIRYAVTTGFPANMIRELLPKLRAQGFLPETVVTPDQVGGGRPAPWMMFEAVRQLGIYPMSCVVKVGDTKADIQEGRNAAAWTVGVVRSGNEMGLGEAEIEAMDPAAQNERVEAARKRLQSFNPYYVIDRITDLTHVLDRISIRISRGERP